MNPRGFCATDGQTMRAHRLAVIAIAWVLIVTLTRGKLSSLHLNFAALPTTWPSSQRGRGKITGLFRRAVTLATLAHCRLIVPSRMATSSSPGNRDRYRRQGRYVIVRHRVA